MAEGMTDAEIAEIRDSLAGITPGPWRNSSAGGVASVTSDDPELGCVVMMNTRYHDTIPETLGRWKADARFIANARNMMPRLLAEIERLRADAGRLDWMQEHYAEIGWLVPNSDPEVCEVWETYEGVRVIASWSASGSGHDLRSAIDAAQQSHPAAHAATTTQRESAGGE